VRYRFVVTAAAPTLARSCPQCGERYPEATVFCPKDGARLRETDDGDDPYLGVVLSPGDIELRSVAGTGAMGRVYRGHQRGIERDVAVKVLHRELSGNAQLVHRFHREARIASRLRHPHVVEVHLTGQLPDGSLYIVMEFLDGRSLGAAIDEAGGRFPLERAVGITLQIADAVGEAHAQGIVHRDLKPENVMLVRRGEVEDWVKVLDFGIARIELGDQSMETAAGRIVGTARYISPEGAAGSPVGPPGDVYGMATMLYRMLAGRTPFDADAAVGLLVKHLSEEPPPLATLAEVPAPIAQVVMDNLAKDPAKRAPNARAFGAALAAAAREAKVSVSDVNVVGRMGRPRSAEIDPTLHQGTTPAPSPARSAPEATAASPSTDATAPASTTTGPAPPPQRRILPILLAFGLGALVTVGGMRFFRGPAPDPERAAYVEHTREVLTDGHYVAPPGENVYDLVEQGLKRWPHDVELKQLRSEAEHEMVTMAMAAQASGDVVGARDLAEGAYRLDATDNSARYLRAQAVDDLAAIESGAAVRTGPPRIVFQSPPLARTGERVEITCRIVRGASSGEVTGLRLSLAPNGSADGTIVVPLEQIDAEHVRGTVAAPYVGSWDVSFEAAIGGTHVRAMRDLDVVP
jgi:serine/threonine-protein kinase